MDLGVVRCLPRGRPAAAVVRARAVVQADRQLGVVGSHRAGPDQHGVGAGAQAVHVPAGGLARDPAAGAVGRGRAAVQAGRQLEHDPGLPGRAVLAIGGQLLGHLVAGHADRDVDPGGAQGGDAPTRHPLVRVLDADDDAGHTRRDDGVGARGRPPLVGAGLERHVERGAAGGVTGLGQGRDLGVRAARRGGGAGEPRSRVRAGARRDDDAAHPGIGRRGRTDRCGLRHRSAHVLHVVHGSGPCPGWIPGLVG